MPDSMKSPPPRAAKGDTWRANVHEERIPMISDELMDAIAHIEAHRQEAQKEAGMATACNEALRKLHELLEREREASQLHGPGARHATHIEALAAEIERVKQLPGATAKPPRPQSRNPLRPAQPRDSPRGRQRRTMGRNRGR